MSQPVLRPAALLAALALTALLGACAAKPGAATGDAAAGDDTGLDRMERLTLTANRCWFKSGDAAFAPYSLAPELSSFSGRPRFLLVPRGKPESKPLLVVEGRKGSTAIDTYGPLMGEPVAARISADLSRWRAGAAGCSA
ncbi:hypothetical protein [Aurantimonas coralicida]|uniref:hypothetical protein n=1 Tax=Aurantimonas coralicida TaxID=182270 RepID=UPI001E35B365|nr:hypothetical protein [Aurantimonas coralicida]MCD1643200.1 hypothetical protein [Aurantimonas coralicida]